MPWSDTLLCAHFALQLAACQGRVEQLEGMLADSEARLQQAHEQAALLAAERDAAARNLLRAEAELNDVSEYSTKMFRQVSQHHAAWVQTQRLH
jgi:hypothetical protein